MATLSPGQNLLIARRLWSLRQVRQLEGRYLELETIGASEASLGMTRLLKAVKYGPELFIERHQGSFWYAHLTQDWTTDQRGPALSCRPVTDLDLLATHTRYQASGALRNEFSWSYSRSTRYRRCARAYYYHYYAAWEGWLKAAPGPVRRTYLLKNLTDIPRWTGSLVHESIKFAMARLKADQPVNEADLVRKLHQRAKADFEASFSGQYRHSPNQLAGFREHFYQVSLSDTVWKTAVSTAKQRLRTFLQSSLYADLCGQPPSSFLDVDTLKSFTVADTKIWVQLDLARRHANEIVVYDWKTGQIDRAEVQKQLAIYGLYARQAWSQGSMLSLRGIAFALAEDQLFEFDLNEPVLRAAQEDIEASIEQLKGQLVDRDSNLAELRRFPMIDDLSICSGCQFRVLCGRNTKVTG